MSKVAEKKEEFVGRLSDPNYVSEQTKRARLVHYVRESTEQALNWGCEEIYHVPGAYQYVYRGNTGNLFMGELDECVATLSIEALDSYHDNIDWEWPETDQL